MNCFKHNKSNAIGICKSCNKAVCEECAIDTGLGLACSEECVKEVNDYNLTMKKSKQLYGVGQSGQKIPTSVILYWAIGSIIFGTGVYNYVAYQRVDLISLLMGGVFLVIGCISYFRNKKVGLNY